MGNAGQARDHWASTPLHVQGLSHQERWTPSRLSRERGGASAGADLGPDSHPLLLLTEGTPHALPPPRTPLPTLGSPNSRGPSKVQGPRGSV